MEQRAPEYTWNAPDAAAKAPKVGVWARLRVRMLNGKKALNVMNAAPASGEGAERAVNLATGLAERTGTPAPQIWSFDGPANAFVVKGDPPIVALSDQLLASVTRTELEAVLAHCIVRLAAKKPSLPIGYDDDVKAASLTRFPPALAAALRKLTPEAGRFAPLYMAGTGPLHRDTEERAAALEDL